MGYGGHKLKLNSFSNYKQCAVQNFIGNCRIILEMLHYEE
jgi:hypothetical protein